MMRLASVCSGIGGAELAFQGIAEHVFASETEAFPRAVLRHHFPGLHLYGDFRDIESHEPVDVLAGGTPCQSFSVAGLRGGMEDERGNLALEYLRLVDRVRPRWVLWENVPGVLSSAGGRDFGAFLGGLGECGYGWAYRCLDAQHFGLAQRRKRVFVVGCLGDWRRAAAVLFEPASLRGDPPPRREAGQGVANALTDRADRGGTNSEGQRLIAPALRGNHWSDHAGDEGRLIAPTLPSRATAGGGLGTDFDCDGGLIAYGGNNTAGSIDVATAVNAHGGPHGRLDFDSETFIAYDVKGVLATRGASETDVHTALRSRAPGHSEASTTTVIAHSLRADGFDASEDGTERGTPLVALPISADAARTGVATTPSRDAAGYVRLRDPSLAIGADGDPMFTLQAGAQHGVATASLVRRLTPTECERLQGFPDGWTDVPYRGKPAADGPRYRALGNAFAVPVVRWIARRIAREHAQHEAVAA